MSLPDPNFQSTTCFTALFHRATICVIMEEQRRLMMRMRRFQTRVSIKTKTACQGVKKKTGRIHTSVRQSAPLQVRCVYYCLRTFFLYTLYISYFVIPTVFFKLACNRHTKSSTTCMISAKLYCQVVLNFWFIGCGPLPFVKDGEWECPGDVSSLSVPVYESCHIVCKGDSAQTRALVKVRCTEKLEWDRVLTSNACSVEKSSGTLNRALSDCAIF